MGASQRMRLPRLPRLLLGLVTVTVLATACGSTVPLDGQPSAGAAGPSGPSSEFAGPETGTDGSLDAFGDEPRGPDAVAPRDPGATSPGSVPPGSTPPGDPAPSEGKPAPGTSGGPDDPEPGTQGSARIPAAADAKGVTDETIQIGIVTTDTTAAFGVAGAMAGQTNESGGDFSEANKAAVEAVNETGGIAGRTVEPVEFFYNIANVTTASGRQQENQRACAHWTEDNQVFAFAGQIGTEEVLVECAARTRTPWIVGGYHVPVSQSRFDSMSPYWYRPPGFVTDRRERAVARFLLDHGFFDGAVVGLMIEDKPMTREGVERGMKPVLAAAGIETVDIHYPDMIESPWSTYVLQLQTEGVTHVVWSAMSSPFPAPLLMLRAAEDQGYRPQWGVGTDTWPSALVLYNAPVEQMANTRGMGWQPVYDVGDVSEQSETARLCSEAMTRRGQPTDNWGYNQCESLFFLQAAFRQAGVVSPEGLAAGVGKLGDGYPSTMTIGGATRFAPGRHDGAALVREVVFDREAGQFAYTGGAEPVPD